MIRRGRRWQEPVIGLDAALDWERLTATATDRVCQVVLESVREAGGRLVTRPPGSRQALPGDGLAAARAVELAARQQVRGYIRQARQYGRSWHQIGTALGLTPANGQNLAEAAWLYALHGSGESGPLTWTCLHCAETITEYGQARAHGYSPQRGHAGDCTLLQV